MIGYFKVANLNPLREKSRQPSPFHAKRVCDAIVLRTLPIIWLSEIFEMPGTFGFETVGQGGPIMVKTLTKSVNY